MELSISLIVRRASMLLSVSCVLAAPVALADDSLVLVTHERSPIDRLTSLEIRKLYLGFPVFTRDGQQITAIVNASEARIMDVFLQNVMAMTRRAYNRRLLTLAVQSGRARPRTFSNLSDLQAELIGDPLLVSCMWRRDAEEISSLRVVKVLWTG